MPNNNPLDSNPEMQMYFNTLPPFVQENLKQTGVDVNSLDELKKCAENLMNTQ